MQDHWFAACRTLKAVLASACLVGSAISPLAAAEPDDFRALTTADLVALCSADPASENYVAAIHFCHGFASGAYQYYLALASASEGHRFVCLPDPPPNRSQAIADFVAWSQQHSEFMDDPPVDTIFRRLAERYPCSQ